MSGSQALSTSGSALTLKATGNVLVDPSTTLQTNAGNITLWSDTDAATSRGGGIKTGAGSSILSTGGAISLSGGTDNVTSWAKGTSTSGDAGIYLGGSINSGSGNIVIRGEETATTTGSNDRAAVFVDKSASITASGSGSVTIDGKVDATNSNTANYHYGVWLGNADSANLATVTTASGAISIKGDATGNSGQYRRGIIFNKASVTSTSGAITLDGQAGTATNCLDFYIFSDSNTISSTSGAVLLKGKAGSASIFETGTISSGAGVTLQLSKLSVSSGKTITLGGASDKIIESTSSENSFVSAVDLTGVAVSTNSTSVRVGKMTNGAAVTFGTSWTTAGPISVYGGTVAVNGSITVTAAGNTFLAKAMGDITTGNSVTVQT
ncbi:MAG: hypothetical protein ORN27_11440, partial [Rhodoluna sp.]|nr:hypothetical protein [Rhodoluna sp.]